MFGAGVDAVSAVQRVSQYLVQGVARQWTSLLLQGGQVGSLFAGKKVTVGGHQQDRSLNLWPNLEQAVQVVSDQQIGSCAAQRTGVVVAAILQPPFRQQRLQQFGEAAAGITDRRDTPAQAFGRHRRGVAGQR
ncbi:hypothetical protein D3C77_486820 [compost metagenome]